MFMLTHFQLGSYIHYETYSLTNLQELIPTLASASMDAITQLKLCLHMHEQTEIAIS